MGFWRAPLKSRHFNFRLTRRKSGLVRLLWNERRTRDPMSASRWFYLGSEQTILCDTMRPKPLWNRHLKFLKFSNGFHKIVLSLSIHPGQDRNSKKKLPTYSGNCTSLEKYKCNFIRNFGPFCNGGTLIRFDKILSGAWELLTLQMLWKFFPSDQKRNVKSKMYDVLLPIMHSITIPLRNKIKLACKYSRKA